MLLREKTGTDDDKGQSDAVMRLPVVRIYLCGVVQFAREMVYAYKTSTVYCVCVHRRRHLFGETGLIVMPVIPFIKSPTVGAQKYITRLHFMYM